jgi:hypothetical protein
MIDAEIDGLFMIVGDVNADGRPDLVKASKKGAVYLYLRTNDKGAPNYHRVVVPKPFQPDGLTAKGDDARPKGVALIEMGGDPSTPEIVLIPEYEAKLWYLTMTGDGMSSENWTNHLMDLPGSESRKKMDHGFRADLDGDGDMDIATTEENGGWGVVWFENSVTR